MLRTIEKVSIPKSINIYVDCTGRGVIDGSQRPEIRDRKLEISATTAEEFARPRANSSELPVSGL
jgi:hypothetical protein